MSYPYFPNTANNNNNNNIQQPVVNNIQPQNFNQLNFQNNIPQIFAQPSGTVYNLNNSNEINSVPTGSGISVGLCLNEELLYIKAMQNGTPAQICYRLVPLDAQKDSVDKKFTDVLRNHDDKIAQIENQLMKIKERIGGNKEWQI